MTVHLDAVKSTSFQPFTEGRPCRHCRYFDGMTGPAALCTLRNAARVRSMPQWGCSGFEREPGADDEVCALCNEALEVGPQRRGIVELRKKPG